MNTIVIKTLIERSFKVKSNWEARINECLVQSFVDKQSETEIEQGFNETLSFGTAGIRNTFGIGPGRLNKFTVQKVALGLANYLNDKKANNKVVIHFDTRHLSKTFGMEIAKVLATENITVKIDAEYKTTPELSFAVRYEQADAGVMITASHNPSNYNGIKVYGPDGGQLLVEPSKELSQYIDEIDPLSVKVKDFETLKNEEKIMFFDSKVTQSYKEKIQHLVGSIPDTEMKTVLTSLHGTSLPLLAEILTDLNYTNYIIEQDQSMPDGDFPTVEIANPEDEKVFDLSKKCAIENEADLLIATDPDADRLGIVERYENGSFRYFNGNEIGLLLMKLRYDTLLEISNPYIIKSVVTGTLSDRLAKDLNIKVIDVLTGFKYISQILKNKESDDDHLVLAYEESHGYLAQDFARDKDAIQIVPLLIKYKAQLKEEHLTLGDVMDNIYKTYGYVMDKTVSPKFEGLKGKDKINQIMDKIRKHVPDEICGLKVLAIEDYLTRKINFKDGSVENISLPETNLIRLIFNEGFIALRPSGTEPKIKIYFSLEVENFNEIVDEFLVNYIK